MGPIVGNYKEFEGDDFFGKSMVAILIVPNKGV